MNTPLNTLGASNLSERSREVNDYYGTNPAAVEDILRRVEFSNKVWEPTAGHHNISDKLEARGYTVRKSDLIDYGFGDELLDFLSYDGSWDGDIIFNPPYKLAQEFVEKSLGLLQPGHMLVAFLRLQFLEGQKRYGTIFSKNNPKKVYVYVKRQVCSSTDDFESESSAVAYAWFEWEKGYTGNTEIEWIL